MSMPPRRQNAYRQLLHTAMLDIRLIEHQPATWNPFKRRRLRRQVKRAGAIAQWLHSMAQFAAFDFEGFDEDRFWTEYEQLAARHPEVGHYRIFFEALATTQRRPGDVTNYATGRHPPTQPVPDVNDADVCRLVQREFAEAEQAAALGRLGGLSPRVAIDLVKLAKGRVDRLAVGPDERDVMAAAEYPGYMSKVDGVRPLPDETLRAIIEADWRQYEDWFLHGSR